MVRGSACGWVGSAAQLTDATRRWEGVVNTKNVAGRWWVVLVVVQWVAGARELLHRFQTGGGVATSRGIMAAGGCGAGGSRYVLGVVANVPPGSKGL